MSTFLRRLKFYGVGFLMGCVMVFFFFKNRGCSWLPGNRVKNSVLERLIVIPDDENAKLKKYNLTVENIIEVLDDGEIDYDKSQKSDKKLKYYVLQKKFHNKNFDFTFTLPKESFISEVRINEIKNVTTTTEGNGKIIYIPNDPYIFSLDTNMRIFCARDYLKTNEKELYKEILKNGKMSFKLSNLEIQPKPEHVFYYPKNGSDSVVFNSIWYKNKILVLDFLNLPDSIYKSCEANPVNN